MKELESLCVNCVFYVNKKCTHQLAVAPDAQFKEYFKARASEIDFDTQVGPGTEPGP